MKVEYTSLGLANRYSDKVEINVALKNNKKLRDYVIKHELSHVDKFDIGHDFDIRVPFLSLSWFILSHPSTWIDFLPIQFRKGMLIYDFNLILLYLGILGLILSLKFIYF